MSSSLHGDTDRPIRPAELPDHWRATVEMLRSYGAGTSADVLERAAKDLEAAFVAEGNEALTLTAAAAECPYTADWLGRLVKQGKIPNAGRRNAPRILRKDFMRFVPGERSRPADTPPPEPSGEAKRRPRSESLAAFRLRAAMSRMQRRDP